MVACVIGYTNVQCWLKVDGVFLLNMTSSNGNFTQADSVSIPIKKGQHITASFGYRAYYDCQRCDFYRFMN